MPTLVVSTIAVEALGPLNTSAFQLFANLGRKISSTSGDELFCSRVSGLVQGYNAVLLHDTLSAPWLRGLMSCTRFCIILIFKLSREHIYRE